MALTGFETFSRVLLGWLGRMLTKDSLGLRNDLVKARIPLLPEDYVASSVMQVITTFVGGVLFTLFLVGFLVPQIEMIEDPASEDGENFAVSNNVQYAIIGILVFVLPVLVGLIQLFTPGWVASSRGVIWIDRYLTLQVTCRPWPRPMLRPHRLSSLLLETGTYMGKSQTMRHGFSTVLNSWDVIWLPR